MRREDIKELMSPLPAMRTVISELVDQATHDRDRLSFLDGQKAYIEIGGNHHPTRKNSGYIAWDPLDGWQAFIVKEDGKLHASCLDEGESLCTLRDAIDTFMENCK